jgi:hypothetical protein
MVTVLVRQGGGGSGIKHLLDFGDHPVVVEVENAPDAYL